MDRLHRKPQPKETRTGRDCQFCRHFDPDFRKHNPMDKLVCSERSDTATAHMTENGYIGHRLLEIRMRMGPLPNVAYPHGGMARTRLLSSLC